MILHFSHFHVTQFPDFNTPGLSQQRRDNLTNLVSLGEGWSKTRVTGTLLTGTLADIQCGVFPMGRPRVQEVSLDLRSVSRTTWPDNFNLSSNLAFFSSQ